MVPTIDDPVIAQASENLYFSQPSPKILFFIYVGRLGVPGWLLSGFLSLTFSFFWLPIGALGLTFSPLYLYNLLKGRRAGRSPQDMLYITYKFI